MAIKELFNDARPQVLFDPRASQRIDPRFKFTRNGPASYYDQNGVLRVMAAPANQPRVGFNYEPDANGVMLPVQGLLLEAAGTNLYPRSQAPTTADVIHTSITLNSAIAPDGTSTAITLTPTNINDHTWAPYFTGLTANTNYTLSLFVKAKELSRIQLGTIDTGGMVFNASTGQIISGSGTVQKLPNEWYRCSVTIPSTGSGVWDTRVYILDNSGNSSYTANGIDGIYMWGFQFEIGSFPTSYIPTAGSTVTRAADLLSVESPLPPTGSIYIDARSLTSDVDTTLLSAAPASPSTDKLALAIRQPASLYNSKALVYEVDGAFKPTLPFPVPSNAQERNLITYGANNYHYRSDSARYTPSSSTSVPANMTRLGIGHDVTDPTKAMTGYINAVYLWPGETTPTVAEALVRGDVDPKDADAGVFTPPAGSLAFVFNTQGTSTDGNTVVQLPLHGSTNNVLVDWGDNTSSSLIGAAASVTVNHTYSSAGIYPVQIEADDDGTNSGLENLQFYANSAADLVRVLQWGGTTTFNPTTMYRAFRDCVQLDFATAARTNLPDTSAITDWREAFYNCSSLSGSFPSFNFSAATNFANAWQGCSSLTSFPLVNTGAATTIRQAWSGCSGLTSFPLINTSLVTDFYGAWNFCSALTSFPLLDTSKGTDFGLAWRSCSSLTNFPLLDTSLATSFYISWENCSSLTSFPLLDSANVINFSYAWRNCSSLTSFPLLNTAKGTDFSYAWDGCSGLTSFPLIDTSKGTNFFIAWRNCSSLTSFPLLNTAKGTDFSYAWISCIGLTSFPSINTSLGTTFRSTWQNCSSLTTFPANFFDSWTGTPANLCFYEAWIGCTSLSPASVVNILDSIAASGQSAPSGTGTHDKKITIDWDGTGDPATDAAAAITTLKSRNWQIYLNNVLQ